MWNLENFWIRLFSKTQTIYFKTIKFRNLTKACKNVFYGNEKVGHFFINQRALGLFLQCTLFITSENISLQKESFHYFEKHFRCSHDDFRCIKKVFTVFWSFHYFEKLFRCKRQRFHYFGKCFTAKREFSLL